MTTEERVAGPVPLYARVLRLRRLRISGLMSFLCVECSVAVAVLLALAELVSWWAVPVLPALVAVVVKINDLVAAPTGRRAEARTASAGTEHEGFFPVNPPHNATTAGGASDGFARSEYDWPTDGYQAGGYQAGGYQAGGRLNERRARVSTQRMPARAEGVSGRHAALSDDEPAAPMPPAAPAAPPPVGPPAAPAAPVGPPAAPLGPPPGVPNVPGAGAPERARIIGAAVRRSMAMQAQFGNGATGAARASGKHARPDADLTTRRRSGMNARHYDRTA